MSYRCTDRRNRNTSPGSSRGRRSRRRVGTRGGSTVPTRREGASGPRQLPEANGSPYLGGRSIYIFPSGYHLLGYLGTTPVETSQTCQTTSTGGNCDFRRYDLSPGNVVITVSNDSGPRSDPIASFEQSGQGTPTQVGGMAAVVSEAQQATDRILLTWKIASPMASNNWIQLDADIRGPGLDALRAQVEALVASFNFTPAPTPS